MNLESIERRLDQTEEDLSRIVALLPREEDLAAYLHLSPKADLFAVANVWWPVLEKAMADRGLSHPRTLKEAKAFLVAVRDGAFGRGPHAAPPRHQPALVVEKAPEKVPDEPAEVAVTGDGRPPGLLRLPGRSGGASEAAPEPLTSSTT